MTHRIPSWATAVVFLLATIVFGTSAALAQSNQPFKGGLATTDYSSGTATVDMRIKADRDFTGGTVSNIQYTLRALASEGVAFGDVSSSPFGLSRAETGTYTAGGETYTYAIYSGSNPQEQDFTAGTPVTMATFDVTGDPSDVIELTISEESDPDSDSDAFPTGSDGRYFIAYDGVGYFKKNNTTPSNEFYQTDPSLNAGQTSLSAGTIPVELTTFTGRADGRDAVLNWKTQSESGNLGFHVQQQTDDGTSWTTITESLIEGAGTSQAPHSYAYTVENLDYGTHTFRLVQIDRDGDRTPYDKRAIVEIQLGEAYVLEGAYPNPFYNRTTLTFTVQQSQSVTVELYNTLGQRVKTLHQGPASAGQSVAVNLSAGDLASGLYFVRLRGENFAASETVTLVR